MTTVAISALPAASAITINDVTVINQSGTTKQAALSLITFASGTRMLFQQTSAPTGWTKDTSNNDKALRLVSGSVSSGGATAFTSVFGTPKTTGSHTLTTDEIPAHTHSVLQSAGDTGAAGSGATPVTTGGTSGSTGGGTGHTHTLSLDLQYVDIIVAQKD